MAKNEKHHLEKRGNVWYFVATKNGKRYHEPLSSSLREAKLMRDNKLAELKDHGQLISGAIKITDNEDILFGEAAKIWAELQEKRLQGGELKDSTWRDYRSAMNLHILPVFGNMRLRDIESYHIDDFVLALSCGGKRKKTYSFP